MGNEVSILQQEEQVSYRNRDGIQTVRERRSSD